MKSLNNTIAYERIRRSAQCKPCDENKVTRKRMHCERGQSASCILIRKVCNRANGLTARSKTSKLEKVKKKKIRERDMIFKFSGFSCAPGA